MSQIIGRGWRLNTTNDLDVKFIVSDSEVDAWSFNIALNKVIMMGAAFKQGDATRLTQAIQAGQESVGEEEFTTKLEKEESIAPKNIFQGKGNLSDKEKAALERLKRKKEAALDAEYAKNVGDYVQAMGEYTKIEAEEHRENGREEDAVASELNQQSLEDTVQALRDIQENIPAMVDDFKKEASQQGYTINNVMDAIKMRQAQGKVESADVVKALAETAKPSSVDAEKDKHRIKREESLRKGGTELTTTPGKVIGRAGAAWALEQKATAEMFGVLTSEDCAPKSRLEKWLTGDNLLAKLRMGVLYFRIRKGEKVTGKEFASFITTSIRWKLMRDYVDDKVALRLFEEFVFGKLQSAEKSIYKLARMYSGIATRTHVDLIKRTTDIAENLMGDDGQYKQEIEEYVHKKAIYEHIQEIKANRITEARENAIADAEKEGRKLSETELKEAVRVTMEQFKDFDVSASHLQELRNRLSQAEQQRADKAHKSLVAFYKGILDELLAEGIITDKSHAVLTTVYPKYVPLYRDLSDKSAADIDAGKILRDLRTGMFDKSLYPLDAFKGSTRDVNNMIDNMIQYHSKARQAIELNRVITSFDYLIEELKDTDYEGQFIKIHKDSSIITEGAYIDNEGNMVSKKELMDLMEDPDAMTEMGIGRVFTSKSKGTTSFVVGRKYGEPVLYEVHPVLVESLRTIQKTDPRALYEKQWKRAAKTIGDVLRVGATATPEFWIRNIVRDAIHGYTVSSSDMEFHNHLIKATGFMLFGNRFTEYEGYEEMWHDYLAQGGGMGTKLNDMVARRMAFRNEVLGMGNPLGNANIYSSKPARVIDAMTVVPINALQKYASGAETMSRFAEYVAAKGQGVSDAEAAFRAMDQQDYGMAGRKIRFLNEVIPFFNAPIQSKYKIARQIAIDPAGFTKKALITITLPTVANLVLTALFANDEQEEKIQEAHESIRANFWLVPFPGTNQVIRIAKPFDTCVIFANALESFYNWAFQVNPVTAKRALREYTADNLRYGLLSWSLMPQVASIFMEASWGKNWFYGTDVVPIVEQSLAPGLQFDSNTHHVPIMMARLAETVGLGNTALASPRRIESLFKTTFASLGTLTLDFIDLFIDSGSSLVGHETYREKMKGEKVTNATTYPILRSFLVRDDYGASVSELYDEYYRLDGKYRSYKVEIDAGRPEMAEKRMSESERIKYHFMKQGFDAMNTMKPGNKAYRAVRDSTFLTAKEKGDFLQEISKSRNRTAREIMLWSKMYDDGVYDMMAKDYDYAAKQRGLFASSESYDERYAKAKTLSNDTQARLKKFNKDFEAWEKGMREKNAQGATR